MTILSPTPSPPPNPAVGDIYFNTGDQRMHVYDGKTWIALGVHPTKPGALEEFKVVCKLDDGLYPEETGQPR